MIAGVTASTREAADAGLAILRRGGNAVDAALAATLASCVADPCNTGLGGYGGYLVVRKRGERARCVQFPLWAPSTMSASHLARAYPEEGPAASAIPNVVGGLGRAHASFGSMTWADIVEPALALAREGVAANHTTRHAFSLNGDRPFLVECFAFDTSGGNLVFRQPALCATLELLAHNGPSWFYAGPLADTACATWQRAGIDVPVADWRGEGEAVKVVDAASFAIDGMLFESAPLGLSGSACLFGTLAAARSISRERALDDVHAIAEWATRMAAVWQYRFATPNGNEIDNVSLAVWIESALAHRAVPQRLAPDIAHTTHVNVVDASGTLVAVTSTHGPAWFGARWAIPGTGVIMNGGMHNFSGKKFVERDGRIFGVSNMAPTIASTSSGDVAIGCPGARRIPSIIGVALARYALGDKDLQQAVAAGRFHAESADLVTFEAARHPQGLRCALKSRFASVGEENDDVYYGPLTAIRSAGNEIETVVDDRAKVGYAASL